MLPEMSLLLISSKLDSGHISYLFLTVAILCLLWYVRFSIQGTWAQQMERSHLFLLSKALWIFCQEVKSISSGRITMT